MTVSPWMRFTVVAAAAHGLYEAGFGANSLEAKTLWLAISIGLAGAAVDPLRHWPAVLIGLLARVAPAIAGSRPPNLILTDAIWWAPLSFILASVYLGRLDALRNRVPEVVSLALHARTDRGPTLHALSRQGPILLVFLRHAGCPFCRETLSDLAAQRRAIEAAGATIVLAHMDKPEAARELFRTYGLDDVHQISDPKRCLYRAFGLNRGNLRMVFGAKAWLRGLDAAVRNRHGLGRVRGDVFQMPGVFMMFHGQILRGYRHQSIADRPNYVRILTDDAFPRMVS